jgi:DDE superfamily endonuclease
MWCIGELTAEYRRRMYDLLELYARPYDSREPVICLDEKSKQLLRETRCPLPAKPATVRKEDYEYERAGTCNIFVAVEPRGQRRIAQVTDRRTKVDFVSFVCRMLRKGYSDARKVHLVLDNLNTHLRESFEEVLGVKTAATLLRRIQFHYTPKHASWLNMAEIEIGVLQRQCLARCAAEQATLAVEVAAWQRRRNADRCGIEWTFTRRDADRKLSRHYVS